MDRLRHRFFWGVTVTTVGLAALCAVTAVSLFREQSRITDALRENVASRKAAVEMEECLEGLIAQEEGGVETVSALHARARQHLGTLRECADQPREQELFAIIETNFDEYLARWRARPKRAAPGHEAAVRDAARFLE